MTENGMVEAYQELLRRLPGVYAAGLRFDDAGRPVEIHILSSTARNPKQIARDVQSALFAAYGLDVDYRIISVAQLPSNPFPGEEAASEEDAASMPGEIRLQIAGIDSTLKNDLFTVAVHLSLAGQLYTGEAQCRDSSYQRSRAVAQATLNAVHAFLGRDMFGLLEVREAPIWGDTVIMSVIECAARDTKVLIGAAVQSESEPIGIVRSTLDALNRVISRFYAPASAGHAI